MVAILRGEEVVAPPPIRSTQTDETSVAVDEGFVYISQHSSGMQTEDGDYVMYGHVAIPALVHQHLLSRGIKPKDIQLALDEHDSNPDHAIDWLLTQYRAATSTSARFAPSLYLIYPLNHMILTLYLH